MWRAILTGVPTSFSFLTTFGAASSPSTTPVALTRHPCASAARSVLQCCACAKRLHASWPRPRAAAADARHKTGEEHTNLSMHAPVAASHQQKHNSSRRERMCAGFNLLVGSGGLDGQHAGVGGRQGTVDVGQAVHVLRAVLQHPACACLTSGHKCNAFNFLGKCTLGLVST